MRTIHPVAVLLVAASSLAVACGGSDAKRDTTSVAASGAAGASGAASASGAAAANADVSFRARDTARTLGAGDVRIANRDKSLEVSLLGDSIYAGFGEKTRAEIKQNTDTSNVMGTGFGANIEKLVKRTVAGALDHEVVFPLKTVSDVKYENGRLQFYNADGTKMHMFETSNKDDQANAASQFSQEEADRFIAAFHARKRS